jgi:Protein of unknown function (DUF998)
MSPDRRTEAYPCAFGSMRSDEACFGTARSETTEIDSARWKVIMHIHNRLLLRCGLVAGPLFIGSFLVEGMTRDGYSPIRHSVSTLSLGPRGWMQIANFAVTGGLSIGFVVGLSRTLCTQIRTRVGPVLLGGAAIGILGAAAFPTDPVSGYPPGTPDVTVSPTTVGKVHDLLSVSSFLSVPVAALAFASAFGRNKERGWATYSAVSGLGMLITFALASLGFSQKEGFVEIAGALQRASIIIGFTWTSSLAARALPAAD